MENKKLFTITCFVIMWNNGGFAEEEQETSSNKFFLTREEAIEHLKSQADYVFDMEHLNELEDFEAPTDREVTVFVNDCLYDAIKGFEWTISLDGSKERNHPFIVEGDTVEACDVPYSYVRKVTLTLSECLCTAIKDQEKGYEKESKATTMGSVKERFLHPNYRHLFEGRSTKIHKWPRRYSLCG